MRGQGTLQPSTLETASWGSQVLGLHHIISPPSPSPAASPAVIYLRLKILPDSGDPLLHLSVIHWQLKNPQLHLHVTPQTQLGELLQKETGGLTLLYGGPRGVPEKPTSGSSSPFSGPSVGLDPALKEWRGANRGAMVPALRTRPHRAASVKVHVPQRHA